MTGNQTYVRLLAIIDAAEPGDKNDLVGRMATRELCRVLVRHVQDVYHATPTAQAIGFEAVAAYLLELANEIRNEQEPLEQEPLEQTPFHPDSPHAQTEAL